MSFGRYIKNLQPSKVFNFRIQNKNLNPQHWGFLVLSFCNIKSNTLDYFLDTTPNKSGKYMPGSHILVKKYTKPLTNEADYVFLGAWNYKQEIFNKEKKYINNGGKFITHVPYPKII